MSIRTVAFSGLLPHPPIVVPEVGRERLEYCQRTSGACADFARRLVQSAPDRLLLVSPHAPRRSRAFGLWLGNRLRGDLSQFGAQAAGIDLPGDEQLTTALGAAAADADASTWHIPARPLDHGAVVPLYFLCEAGWSGPTTVVSLPAESDPAPLATFGRAVGRALEQSPGRTALVASGDMTHRATAEGPYGFDRRGLVFDEQLQQLVREDRLDEIAAIDPGLREAACEDAADSSIVIAAAVDYVTHGREVLSYEHPFGVGYLVAVFHDGGGTDGA